MNDTLWVIIWIGVGSLVVSGVIMGYNIGEEDLKAHEYECKNICESHNGVFIKYEDNKNYDNPICTCQEPQGIETYTMT